MDGWGSRRGLPVTPGSGGMPGSDGVVLFREVQRFRTWIFVLPVAAVTIIVWYMFIQQIVLGHPQGSEPLPAGWVWALTMVFGLGFPGFGVVVRLITMVRPGELRVRLFPFRVKVIPVGTIVEAAVRHYSPIGEFGGWGMRFSRKNGRAYNAYGEEGVQLVLSDGTRLLVGSQQPEQLLTALRQAGGGFGEAAGKRRART